MGSPIYRSLVGACLLISACGESTIQRLAPDAVPDAGAYQPPPAPLTHLREDFDNLRMVESTDPAGVVDVNRGIAALATYSFPTIAGDGTDTYAASVVVNDVREAQVIRIEENGALEVPDSVELRATDTITVAGSIRAGAGGVILAAQNGIFLEAGSLIESRGPIRLLLGDPQGEIRIDGELYTRALQEDKEVPTIEIIGRGRLLVAGKIMTFAEPGEQGGEIFLNTYGSIEISGRGARVAATAQQGATPGRVRIFGESTLTIAGSASVGTGYNYDSIEGSLGGSVELRANAVAVQAASVTGGRGPQVGGDVQITAKERLLIDPASLIQGGAGPKGGTTGLRTRDLSLNGPATVAGGLGDREGGELSIEATSRIFVDGAGLLAAGDAVCGDGGHASLSTGGLIQATGGAVIRGGDAGMISARCSRMGVGGDVVMQGASFLGLETGVRGGTGEPMGHVVQNQSTLLLNEPDLSLGTSGRVRSKIFDRGEASVGRRPVLLDFGGETPVGTSITVRLCGVDGPNDPFLDWRDVTEPEGEPLEAFRNARYFRYRVELHGRAFDTPVLNYFEIDLAPAE